MSGNAERLYAHPFSRDYWRDAAAEMKNTRTLVFAALMIALRVAFKAVRIPVGPYLNINTAFLVNALGAMCFGPVVAIPAAAITDFLGAMLFPEGVYFPPFMLTEIAGSVLFAMFFYRARISLRRIFLARLSVNFLVNLVLQTPIMILYYQVVLGKGYAWFDLPRILKNLTLFPLEALLLALVFRMAMPPLEKQHLIRSRSENLELTRKSIAGLAGLSLISVGIFVGGSIWLHNNVSLSASYTAQQREEANLNCLQRIREQDPDLADADITAVVESAYTPFLSGNTTWNVAVYDILPEELAKKPEGFSGFSGYSKSKAAADPALSRRYAAVLTTDGSGKVLSFEKK